MADAGDLPASLGHVHEKSRTPLLATLAVGAAACLFTLAGDIGFVAGLTNFTLFLTFSVINATVVLLRVRFPGIRRPFAVPGSVLGIPLLPVAGVVASVALLTRLDSAVIGLGAVLVVLGTGYALARIPRGEPGSPG